jgi:hypothetical protein
MQEPRTAALFSDFDGTAVAKLSNMHPWRWPQNMAKYPLRRIEGWADFINGALSVEGVHYEGLVSRRGKAREKVTRLSLARTGLDPDFDRMVLAGSEQKKAEALARRAVELVGSATVGVVEDMPQKLVPELLKILDAIAPYPDLLLPPPRLTIGVVSNRRAAERIEETTELLEAIRGAESHHDGYYYGADIRNQRDGGLTVSSGKMTIDVIPLPAYSFGAGVEFGERLVS